MKQTQQYDTIIRIVEFSDFYPHEKFNAENALKKFNKENLIRIACLLSCNYGNFYNPDNQKTFFSFESIVYQTKLNNEFTSYRKRLRIPKDKLICLSTYRTAAELWRMIFSIPEEDFTNTIKDEDQEYTLFKILLTINEKIYHIKKDNSTKPLKQDELLYCNSFISNDCNLFDFKKITAVQLQYAYMLALFIQTNETMQKASKILFNQWGINNWKEYIATLLWFSNETEQYRKNNERGVPLLRLDKIQDETGLFSKNLINSLSINEESYLQYITNTKDRDNNNDYRYFRAKPFIKLKDGNTFLAVNIQFIAERIFNSLYFDFMPLINGGKSSVGYVDFNKDFTENFLFRKSVNQCMQKRSFIYPPIDGEIHRKEDNNEPDFYCRHSTDILLFECKAIKMNAIIKDTGDFNRLLDELHEKIVIKTKNLDSKRKPMKGKPEGIGIGQLVHHIKNIEDDTFKWDTNIPNQVRYYPILVFEDPRLIQPGLLSITNRWYKEELKRQNIDLNKIASSPLITMTIATFYKYRSIIHKRGLNNLIDEFEKESLCIDEKGSEFFSPTQSFDDFMSNFKLDENKEFIKWIISPIKQL